MEPQKKSQQEIVEILERQLQEQGLRFFDDTLTFSFWLHGGDPGEGFTSDFLQISSDGDRIDGQYIRTRFNMEYDPPYLAEKFFTTLETQKAHEIIESVLKNPLFRNEYASEKEPDIADILKEDWNLVKPPFVLQKKFYQNFPEDMARLRKICHELMLYIEGVGDKIILNPKRSEKEEKADKSENK